MDGRPQFESGYERRFAGLDGRGEYSVHAERPGASVPPRETDWDRGLIRRPGQDAPPVPLLEDRNIGPGGPAISGLRSGFGDDPGPFRRDFPGAFFDDIRDPRDRGPEPRFIGREPPLDILREPRDLRDLGPPRDVGPLRDSRDMGPLKEPRDLGPLREPRDLGPPRELLPPRDMIHPRDEADRFVSGSRMSGSGIVPDLSNLSGVSATLASLSNTLPSLGVKEPVVRGQCLLLPPPAGSVPETSSRPRPEYCKTVFVGHLPRNTTRQSLYDIFEACGNIIGVRLNPRSNFAHIQFDREDAVDRAMELNNYSIKVDLSGDLGSMGKIIVDYAASRGDVPPEADPERAAEIESRRRAREQRHKRERSESPPPSFTDSAAAEMKENFRKETCFEDSCKALASWLEKGLCNRHNTEKFFSLIQTAEGCLKRVLREKRDTELEVRRFIAEIQLKQDGMKRQSLSFCKIFAIFEKQDKKLLDLYTRPQRKMLQQWTGDAKKLMKEKWVNLLSIAGENGMTCLEEEEEQEREREKKSRKDKKDSKEPESKRSKSDPGDTKDSELKRKSDTDRKQDSDKQLKAMKDDMAKLKAQYKEKLESRDKEIAKLKEMVGKGRPSRRERPERGDEVPPDDDEDMIIPKPVLKKESPLPDKKQAPASQVMLVKVKQEGQVSDDMVISSNNREVTDPTSDKASVLLHIKEEEVPDEPEGRLQIVEDSYMESGEQFVKTKPIGDGDHTAEVVAGESVGYDVKEEWVNPEMRVALAGVVAAYLSVHPHGASFSNVIQYLRNLGCPVSSSIIWSVLCESPLAFTAQPEGSRLRKEACDGVVWFFNGFAGITAVC